VKGKGRGKRGKEKGKGKGRGKAGPCAARKSECCAATKSVTVKRSRKRRKGKMKRRCMFNVNAIKKDPFSPGPPQQTLTQQRGGGRGEKGEERKGGRGAGWVT